MHSHISEGGYNLTYGGDGTLGRLCTKETSEKIGAANKGKKAWNKGKKCKQFAGKNNPMAGKTVYNIWVEKYGIEEANKRLKELKKKMGTRIVSEENKRKQSIRQIGGTSGMKGKISWNNGMNKDEEIYYRTLDKEKRKEFRKLKNVIK